MERKYQKGFDEGYQKAKDDLENEYSEELLKKTEEFYQILADFELKLIDYEKSFDKIVINVSTKIAEKIIQREVENKTAIQNTLKEAVRKILGANEIIIKINPQDYNSITHDGTQKDLEKNFSKIRFEQDENIDIGGCLIESETGNVDARISTQLDEITKQLKNNIMNEE
jgi:flagellar assembly protein FliH